VTPIGERVLPGLLDADVVADPHPFYRRLRAEHPCHWDESIGSWLVTRHADVGQGYRDPAFTTKNYEWQLQPVFGRGLLQMDGREHARKRALVNPHFRGKGAERWDGVIARNANVLIDRIVARRVEQLTAAQRTGEVDFCAEYAHHLPIAVIADVLGLPERDQPQFFAWYTAMIGFLSNLAKDPAVAEAGVRAKAEFDAYITPFILERRAEPGEDLISAMCVAVVDGENLDDVEVRTHVTQLLVAGAETTDRTLGNMVGLLLMNPEQFAAVRDDRALVPAAIAETLRHSPPSQMNARVLDREVEIAGQPVPAGATVTLVIASANRDERRYADPDRFDISRADLAPERSFTAAGEHFAFGSGRHFCLGAMLAKAELEYSANALLDRFPGMRLAEGFTPTFTGLKMRAITELRLVL
jgi:cytochrome P450